MRSKVRKEAEGDSQGLLRSTNRRGFAVEPVGIARRLGIVVDEAELDEATLGALFIKRSVDPRIVVNRRHGFFRRRSTCALEMGHYVRMSARTNEYKRADLWDGFEQVGGVGDEDYAREFGASLLMPEEEVKIMADLRLDDLEMAMRLRVPREEMQRRLHGLGLRSFELEVER